ncbi:MAG: hypothetical protein ACXWRA_14145 [Pseudobdellovibrionaceae bacterium]
MVKRYELNLNMNEVLNMIKNLTVLKQIALLTLFLSTTALGDEIRLPISSNSIKIQTEGIMGSALDAIFLTDTSRGEMSEIICGRPKGSGIVMVLVFGRELELYMDDQQCMQQLTNALQDIHSGKAKGLKIKSGKPRFIESIQTY